MNRVFVAMIVAAFSFTAWQEWTAPPAPPPAPATEAAPLDPAVQPLADRLGKLEGRVDRLPLVPPDRKPGASPMQRLTDGVFDTSKSAFNLTLGLVGGMTFFLGVMKVAEAAGLLAVIAKLIRPLMVRAFPDVPPDHPAMGAMIMNLSANALGLGNAATPFGIKAMQELEKLNRHPGTATNAMVLFLAINTSSITLLPTDVIVWRSSLGSTDPSGILPTTLLSTMVSTGIAIALCRALQGRFALPDGAGRDLPDDAGREASEAYPMWVSAVALSALALAIPLAVIFGRQLSPWIVPSLAVSVLGYGAARGVPVYEQFVAGAREGVEVCLRIVPYLVAILVAVNMLTTSGVMGMLTGALGPVTSAFGLPAAALPMALIRPFSGSGANGLMVGAMREHGPDSYTGYLVSTIQGSSETTFYVLSVYFGAIQVKNLRHAPWVGILADCAGVLSAIAAVKLYFVWNGLSG